jgi:hypothetical protein
MNVGKTYTKGDGRPRLRRVELAGVLPLGPGLAYVTMSPGQWDSLLAAADSVGWVLLELGESEEPVAAYQRPPVTWN